MIMSIIRRSSIGCLNQLLQERLGVKEMPGYFDAVYIVGAFFDAGE